MQLSQHKPSITQTEEPELCSDKQKEVLQETQQALGDLSQSVVADTPSETNNPSLKGMADKLSTETNASMHNVTIAIEAACLEFGIDPGIIGTDPDIDKEVLDLARSELTTILEKNKSDQSLSVTVRFNQLKEEGVPLQDTLKALRTEFKGKIDEETSIILSRYEALFSEEVLPDKEERKAVETLFFSQNVKTFTAASFTGFVHTLYDQPDDVISEETKVRIEKKFQIPHQRITTGAQFAKAAFAKDEDGNYQHDSPDHALRLDNGMSSYVQPNGEAVVTYEAPQSAPKIIYVRSLETWFSEDAAKNINYGIIRDEVFDNLDQMTGLFGGDQEEHDWMAQEHRKPVERANRFVRLLIGNREPNYILQYEDIPHLRSSLKAMVNPLNQSEEENYNDLRELGVLNGDQINWSRLKTIGLILRRNRYYKTQAVRNPAAPYQLLEKEVKKLDHNETEKETTSAFAESGGHHYGSLIQLVKHQRPSK